jgi:hypothetical protein
MNWISRVEPRQRRQACELGCCFVSPGDHSFVPEGLGLPWDIQRAVAARQHKNTPRTSGNVTEYSLDHSRHLLAVLFLRNFGNLDGSGSISLLLVVQACLLSLQPQG